MWTFLSSRPVVCLLVAAFLLRVGMVFVVQGLLEHHWQRNFVIEGDADGYWRLAQKIVAGEEYAIYEPPRYVLRMPGFPLLLSLPMALSGGSFVVARLILAAWGTVAVGLVYLFGKELFDHRAGLWAGWFTAVSPAMVGFSVIILSETAFAVGVVLSVWATARLVRQIQEQIYPPHPSPLPPGERGQSGPPHPSPLPPGERGQNTTKMTRADLTSKNSTITSKNSTITSKNSTIIGWSLLAGLGIALGTYMRPSWLPMVLALPALVVIASRFQRRAWLGAGVIVATVALSLLPWAWRNHQVTGHWVVTTLWSGPSLYDGLNPDATGASDMHFLKRDDPFRTMTEYEVNQYYWQAGWEYARNHPRRAVELAFVKLWRFWKPWPSAEEAGHWAAKTVIAVFSLALFAGALYGVGLYRRRWMMLALTLGPVLFFSALHAIFVGSLRYRLPAEYPLAVLAAAGWLVLWQRCFAGHPQQEPSHAEP